MDANQPSQLLLLPPRTRRATNRYQPLDSNKQVLSNVPTIIVPAKLGIHEIRRIFNNGFVTRLVWQQKRNLEWTSGAEL